MVVFKSRRRQTPDHHSAAGRGVPPFWRGPTWDVHRRFAAWAVLATTGAAAPGFNYGFGARPDATMGPVERHRAAAAARAWRVYCPSPTRGAAGPKPPQYPPAGEGNPHPAPTEGWVRCFLPAWGARAA